MFNNIRKHAFTLAEVLVTLGIIGVVSAMTIPSLTQSWQKQAYAAQLKKTYSQLAQAAAMAIQEEYAVSLDESKYVGKEGGKEFLRKYLKIVNDCGTSYTPCFARKYKNIDGSENNNLARPDLVITTADGVSISMLNYWYFGARHYDHDCLSLIVDINGQKGPNVVGRDLFYIEVYSDGKVAESYDDEYRSLYRSGDAKQSCIEGWGYAGLGCLTNIMNNGWVMDY